MDGKVAMCSVLDAHWDAICPWYTWEHSICNMLLCEAGCVWKHSDPDVLLDEGRRERYFRRIPTNIEFK